MNTYLRLNKMIPKLEVQVNKTQAGLCTVTYGYKEASLVDQEAAFAANRLGMVSPAQFGFLLAHEDKDTFKLYGSRTNADVLYDARTNQVVTVPDEAISKLVGIANLVAAHKEGKEYVIPENQRADVYDMVDEMLKKGRAITGNHGQTVINTSEFGQTELTSKLFSDEGLGIKAQDYGDWLQKEQRRNRQSIFFNEQDYAKSQEGPYLNRLIVSAHGFDFIVYGDYRHLGNDLGAFGVRFEKTAEGGAKKS